MKMKKYNMLIFQSLPCLQKIPLWYLFGALILPINILLGQKVNHDPITFDLTNFRKVTFTSPEDRDRYHQSIIRGMEDVMGPLPDRKSLPSLNIRKIDSLRTDKYIKYKIDFLAHENERVSANLYMPVDHDPRIKLAGILALHPTGEKGKEIVDGKGPYPNRAYAKELAERGYVVIAPDYPSFGDLKNHDFSSDRYQSGTMAGIFYHMRSVDVLEHLDIIDRERIGVIGHSLGGHNAIFLAAFDPRIKVVVSSCGWTLFPYYDQDVIIGKHFGGRFGCWAQQRYMPLFWDKYHLNLEDFPFDFDQAIFAIAPRAFFSNSPLHDNDFYVKGVEKGMINIKRLYNWLGVSSKLEVHYPDADHDFPTDVRTQAYSFLDRQLSHSPLPHFIE